MSAGRGQIPTGKGETMGPNMNLGQLRVWAQTRSADETEEIAMATFRELDEFLSAGGSLPSEWNPTELVWSAQGVNVWQAHSRATGGLYTLTYDSGPLLWSLRLTYPSGACVVWTEFNSEFEAKRDADAHERGYQR